MASRRWKQDRNGCGSFAIEAKAQFFQLDRCGLSAPTASNSGGYPHSSGISGAPTAGITCSRMTRRLHVALQRSSRFTPLVFRRVSIYHIQLSYGRTESTQILTGTALRPRRKSGYSLGAIEKDFSIRVPDSRIDQIALNNLKPTLGSYQNSSAPRIR